MHVVDQGLTHVAVVGQFEQCVAEFPEQQIIAECYTEETTV
jgi:hypothetical protein